MSLEKVEVCPLCNGKSLHPFLLCKDYTVTGELFHVEQCAQCGMTLTNPRPSGDSVGQYYKSNQYISHSSKSTGFIDRIYLIIRQFTIFWKFNLIKAHLTENTLLDFGCGTGNFAGFCNARKIDTYGVEPSAVARASAAEQNVKVFSGLEELPNTKFSVVTLWHVLEHVYSLKETLAKIKDHLSDNGTIFIAVPNLDSTDAKHYNKIWAGFDVPRHVWHFSQKNMESLLNQSGLNLVNKKPMKLDSYYVSMLSEKYKNQGKLSIIGIIKAIYIGFKSNCNARRNFNYSSIIYMAKK